MSAASGEESVAHYIAALPQGRRDMVQRVHDRIREAVPELEVRMWNRVIGYGSYHYEYASGREGDWFPVGLANNARYISLYLCAADDEGYLAERNADRLGNVSVGKSCVRFKKPEDLDLDVVAELCRRAAELVAAGRYAM